MKVLDRYEQMMADNLLNIVCTYEKEIRVVMENSSPRSPRRVRSPRFRPELKPGDGVRTRDSRIKCDGGKGVPMGLFPHTRYATNASLTAMIARTE